MRGLVVSTIRLIELNISLDNIRCWTVRLKSFIIIVLKSGGRKKNANQEDVQGSEPQTAI